MGADLSSRSPVQICAFFSVAFPVAYAYGQIFSSTVDAFEICSLTGDIAPLCATPIFLYPLAFPVLIGCEAGDVMAKLRFDPSVPQVQGFADLTIR